MPGVTWPAPLFLFDANTRGSGKGLLADVIAIICTGDNVPRMTFSDDEREMRKLLMSMALDGRSLAFFDEARVLKGDALNAVLTGRTIQDRVLGHSKMVTARMAATFYAAGNNVQVKSDAARRVIPIRLESPLEHPEERSDFRYPSLRDYVRKNRPRFVAAALTILRAFRLACGPERLPPLGSYEGWSRNVRDPLVWAGCADPCATRKTVLETEPEGAQLKLVLEGWLEAAGPEAITVREALKRLEQARTLRAALEEIAPSAGGAFDARRVGNALKRLKRRWCSGMRLVDAGKDRKGFALWKIEVVPHGADSAESAPS